MVTMEFESKIANAAKWSSITELVAKLIAPINSMILARVLAPEVFGIVASVNMVISFCDLFADAGFQKYIVQHQADRGITPYVNVAFWTNLVISLLIWAIVAFFATPIATLVACPGKELAIIVACANLPLVAFTSIQTAVLRREMNFKPLFFIRIVTILAPLIVTVPLAFITHSYWSMIIGTICANAGTTVIVMKMLKWHPTLSFDFKRLREMLSFSIWSMIESLLVWVINWGDIFIITNLLSQYYVGLYKTSMGFVNQVISIISASMVPVLLAALSRLQSDNDKFRETYYHFSFLSGLLLIPMGIGMWLYKDTFCIVALGYEWLEAATLMGVWGFVSAIAILLNSYNGVVLIAKGKPKLSVFVQLLQIVCIIPAVYFAAQTDFTTLSYVRAFVRFAGMFAYCVVVHKMTDIRFKHVIKQLLPAIVGSAIMAAAGFFFVSLHWGILFEIVSIVLCFVIYVAAIMLFPSTRTILLGYANSLLKRIKR